jgi:peptide/nickel transport system substrate-binding protein
MSSSRIVRRLLAVLLLLASLALPADARTLRWSSQGDPGTLDPHAMNEELTMTMLSQIYEPLVTRDQRMELRPHLATSWEAASPTLWRFQIREGVRFHDGNLLTAEDVAYSINRARHPISPFRIFVGLIKEARAIGPLTVEIETTAPDPILVPKLTSILIMSRAWSEQHGVRTPQDMSTRTSNYATLNTNGTGPYRLRVREPDVRTVLDAHTAWWGQREGNVTEVTYRPIANDATRISALLSGELDLVIDPPLQDVERLRRTPNMSLMQTNEFRTVFFAADVFRDELLYSDVRGANPFKDRRVRQAMYQAIDAEAIRSRVMRGFAVLTGTSVAPGNTGWRPDLDVRRPFDADAARRLLAEAGYPNGFGFTMDCPNNRYINDEQICNAVAAMWARIGLRARVNAIPRQIYFPKTYNLDVSVYLIGINSPFLDSIYGASGVLETRTDGGSGTSNYGRYSNPEVDRLIAAARTEMDPRRREEMLHRIFEIEREDVAIIPLHHQVIVYAMRNNISMTQRSDNRVEIRWVTVN